MTTVPRLLLLSNSRNPGGQYLEHAREPILAILGSVRDRILFIPYAGVTVGATDYTTRVTHAAAPWGLGIHSIAEAPDPVAAVQTASAIMVGGGNTFQLLARCQQLGLLAAMRERVRSGGGRISAGVRGPILPVPPFRPPTTCWSSNRRRSSLWI